jgi:hypothetical protein
MLARLSASIPRFPIAGEVGHDRIGRGFDRQRRMVVAKKKPSALKALARLNDERLALEARAAELRRAAALELGMVVLDAGGADLGPARLRDLISKAVAAGPDAASRTVSSKGESMAAATQTKPTPSVSAEADHG